jgi:dolichyl-phosphate-mannose-protein mannosyltransferase
MYSTPGIYSSTAASRHFHNGTGMFFLAWATHYLPFFLMSRSLFLHHYLPSLIYSFLITASLFDFAFKRFKLQKWTRLLIVSCVILSSFAVFVFYAPTTYGLPLTKEQVGQRKLFKGWDFQHAPAANKPKEVSSS